MMTYFSSEKLHMEIAPDETVALGAAVKGAALDAPEDMSNVGRPFIVDGIARVAPLTFSPASAAWSNGNERSSRPKAERKPPAAPSAATSDLDLRVMLGRYWASAGAVEHASVASFSRHALQLLALGAPPELLRRTHQAAIDEVHHAELSFELAASYTGVAVSPHPLNMSGAVGPADLNPTATLRSVIAEGCVGETLAAAEARVAAEHVTDPQVRAVLDTIATDEAGHAALAWDFVRWYLTGWANGATVAARRSLVVKTFDVALQTRVSAATRAISARPITPTARQMLFAGAVVPEARAQLQIWFATKLIRPAINDLLIESSPHKGGAPPAAALSMGARIATVLPKHLPQFPDDGA